MRFNYLGSDAISLSKGVGDFNRHQAFSLSFWTRPLFSISVPWSLKDPKLGPKPPASRSGYERVLEK